jgi:hypothetical protein
LQEVVGTPAAEGAASSAPVPSSNPPILSKLKRIERLALHVETCRQSLRLAHLRAPSVWGRRLERFVRALNLQYEARMSLLERLIRCEVLETRLHLEGGGL